MCVDKFEQDKPPLGCDLFSSVCLGPGPLVMNGSENIDKPDYRLAMDLISFF